MQLSFEFYVRELTHWRVVWPMLPKWKNGGLVAIELVALIGCAMAYYLLGNELWAIVAMLGVGLVALVANYRLGARWVRAFMKKEGRPVAEGVSYPELIRGLRMDRLLTSAAATGKRAIDRVIQIEIESTQSQAELDRRRGGVLPSWFGKLAVTVGTLGLGLIINIPDTPVEKFRLFAERVLPLIASGAAVFLMVPRLPSKESQVLDYLSLLFRAKRALELAAVDGDGHVGGSRTEPLPARAHQEPAPAVAQAPQA